MNHMKKLRTALSERGIDALLVLDELNQHYLSGFAFTDGFLLIAPVASSCFICRLTVEGDLPVALITSFCVNSRSPKASSMYACAGAGAGVLLVSY